jgi:tRNA (guanosine-2'-O-)-methyltransferase
MKPERKERLRQVAYRRQFDLTVILENVHDQHNIGAVLRSCDSVGIREIFVLYSEPDIQIKNVKLGKRTSAGTRKWVDVHFYTDTEACFQHVRSSYDRILATHLDEEARSLYHLDLTRSTALLFGNEHAGLSSEALAHADGNFLIPQSGMVQSLNISVACAVTLYEAYRQRYAKGYYGEDNPTPAAEQEALFQDYIRRHEEAARLRRATPKDPDSLL